MWMGADTLEEAVEIRQELNDMLSRAQMMLRKQRSSSKQLLQTIPDNIKESGGRSPHLYQSD